MQRVKLPCGKSITVEINYGAARKLTKLLGFALCDPASSARVGGPERYELLPEILAVLCGEEITRVFPEHRFNNDLELIVGFLDEQLGTEPVFQAAHAALTEEWGDFLALRGHSNHAASVRSLTRFVVSDLQATEARFASSLQDAQRLVEKREEGTRGSGSSAGPESLGSTQSPLPSPGFVSVCEPAGGLNGSDSDGSPCTS